VHRELLEHREHLEQRRRERLECLEHREHREHLERLEHRERRERLRQHQKKIERGMSGYILATRIYPNSLTYRHIGQEDTMKSSIRDKAEGTFHEVKGKVKEVAGKLTDNPKLEAEGTSERIAGKVQEKVGQVKKVLGE